MQYTPTVLSHSQSNRSETPFNVTFPQRHDSNSLQQDEECAEIHIGGKKQQVRVQDYDMMYAQPGLYE